MGTMSLTPADIRDKKFHTVRLRPGYNEEDVDALLDRIEATLVALEGGPRTGPLITADEVREARFRTTRFSPGYKEDEVDDFLDLVISDLAGRGLGRVEPTLPSPTSSPPPPLPPEPQVPQGRPSHSQWPPSGALSPPGHHEGGWAEPAQSSVLTAKDVREQQFATTRLTTGYNEQEVDEFLDRAEFTLAVLQQGRPDRATLTSAEVERIQFATTRARPGYDPEHVDRFLDVLAESLRAYEQG